MSNIGSRLYGRYQTQSIFIQKKARYIFFVSLVLIILGAIALFVHSTMNTGTGWYFVVGDLIMILCGIAALLFWFRCRLDWAVLSVFLLFLGSLCLHNLIGDWLATQNATHYRVLETVVTLFLMLFVVGLISFNMFHACLSIIISFFLTIGHSFIVVYRFYGLAPDSSTIEHLIFYNFIMLVGGLFSLLYVRQVNDTIKELMFAQEKLVQKEKLSILGQLSASIDHELRNPLGVISNAVYYLKNIMITTEQSVNEYLDIIKSEIDHSLRIVSDLHSFANPSKTQAKSLSVQKTVEGCLSCCDVPDNVKIILELPGDTPGIVADRQQLMQILQNLITNAIQAMTDGGIIRVASRVQTIDSAKMVELIIEDSGQGIAPDLLPQLFQPLFSTRTSGLGLGLVVCKNLVEANHGHIEITSMPAVGTKVTLTLPADIDR